MILESTFSPSVTRAARRAIVVAGVLALAAAALADEAGIEITLKAAPDQTGSMGPYRQADLKLVSHGDQVLREISLRWTEGGPTFVWPVALGPGAQLTKRVFLPVGAPLQTYRATFKGDPPAPPGRATISWPIEMVARDALINPSAYESVERPGAKWSAPLRLNVMLGAAVTALAAAATLFCRPHVLRTCALLGIIALTAGAGALTLANTDVVIEDVITVDDGRANAARYLYVVAVRRTTRWTHPDARLAPVYKDASQMDGETMTIDPRHGAEAVISPGELRLFHAAARGG